MGLRVPHVPGVNYDLRLKSDLYLSLYSSSQEGFMGRNAFTHWQRGNCLFVSLRLP